jgi:hypothetical protein
MRKLKTSDIFALTRIVKKMNIKKEIAEVAKDVSGFTADEKVKAEATMQTSIILIFVENLGSAETEIYKLLADVTGTTAEDIENMDIDLLIPMIKELFSQEGIGSFLSVALK